MNRWPLHGHPTDFAARARRRRPGRRRFSAALYCLSVWASAAGAAAPVAQAAPSAAPAASAAHAGPPDAVLSLEDAVALTLRLLPAIEVSAASRDAAYARVVQARSPWLPALTGSIAYARQTANFVLRPGMLPSTLAGNAAQNSSRSQSFNYFSGQLQLSQLLLDFGATYHALGASRALARQSDTQVTQTALEATCATRIAFFAAQGARAQQAVAEQTLRNQLRHRAQILGQVTVGQRPPIDLAQADTDVSQAKVADISARNAAAVAHSALMQAIGVEGLDAPYAVSDDSMPAVANEDAAPEVLLAEAMAHRPEVLGLEQAAAAQQHKLRAIQAQLLPQVTGSGSITDAGQDLDRLGWNWTGQVVLSWPLLAGGNSIGMLREAQAGQRLAQGNINTLRNAIRLELRRAQLGVSAAKQSLIAAGDGIKSATSQLALAEGRYSTGLGSVIELGDAQLAWATAHSQQVQAEVDLATARASLIKALGRAS